MDLFSKYFRFTWERHSDTVSDRLFDYLKEEKFTDMSLLCEDRIIKCHKLILSTASHFFEEKLQKHPQQFPVLILNNINYCTMKKMLEFIYKKQVTVDEGEISEFLQAAKQLKLKDIIEENGKVIDLNEAKSWYFSAPTFEEDHSKITKKYKNYSESDMNSALELVKVGVHPVVAADVNSVPLRTLYDKLRASDIPEMNRLGRRKSQSRSHVVAERTQAATKQSSGLQLIRKEVPAAAGCENETKSRGEEQAVSVAEEKSLVGSQPISASHDDEDDDDIMFAGVFNPASKGKVLDNIDLD